MNTDKLIEYIKNNPKVESVKSRVMFFDNDSRSPRTEMVTSVAFKQGPEWHFRSERSGGDFRDDNELLCLAIKT